VEELDLEELGRQLLAPTNFEDEFRCMRCREEYSLTNDNAEPGRFCDPCAHEVAEDIAPALIAEVRALRAQGQGGWIPGSPPAPGSYWIVMWLKCPDRWEVRLVDISPALLSPGGRLLLKMNGGAAPPEPKQPGEST
jgi:hypothetical protein